MEDLFGILILVIFCAVTIIAFFLAIRILFPIRVNLVQKAAEETHPRAFWLGLVNTLFIAAVIIGLVAMSENIGSGVISILAIILMIFFVVVLSLGLTAVIQMVGVRLVPEANTNRRFLMGALVVVLGSLTPFIGWFGLFLYVSFLGVGSVIVSFFSKSKKTPAEEITAE